MLTVWQYPVYGIDLLFDFYYIHLQLRIIGIDYIVDYNKIKSVESVSLPDIIPAEKFRRIAKQLNIAVKPAFLVLSSTLRDCSLMV